MFPPESPGALLDLILLTANFDSTDPRDKIFALVGLSKNVEEYFIDYTKSIDEILIYIAKAQEDNST